MTRSLRLESALAGSNIATAALLVQVFAGATFVLMSAGDTEAGLVRYPFAVVVACGCLAVGSLLQAALFTLAGGLAPVGFAVLAGIAFYNLEWLRSVPTSWFGLIVAVVSVFVLWMLARGLAEAGAAFSSWGVFVAELVIVMTGMFVEEGGVTGGGLLAVPVLVTAVATLVGYLNDKRFHDAVRTLDPPLG